MQVVAAPGERQLPRAERGRGGRECCPGSARPRCRRGAAAGCRGSRARRPRSADRPCAAARGGCRGSSRRRRPEPAHAAAPAAPRAIPARNGHAPADRPAPAIAAPPPPPDCTLAVCLAARARIASGVRRESPRGPRGEPGGKAIQKDDSQERLRPAPRGGGGGRRMPEEGRGAEGRDVAGGDDDRGREGRLRPRRGHRPAGGAAGEGPQPDPGRDGDPEEGAWPRRSPARSRSTTSSSTARSCRRGPRPRPRPPPPPRRRSRPHSAKARRPRRGR